MVTTTITIPKRDLFADQQGGGGNTMHLTVQPRDPESAQTDRQTDRQTESTITFSSASEFTNYAGAWLSELILSASDALPTHWFTCVTAALDAEICNFVAGLLSLDVRKDEIKLAALNAAKEEIQRGEDQGLSWTETHWNASYAFSETLIDGALAMAGDIGLGFGTLFLDCLTWKYRLAQAIQDGTFFEPERPAHMTHEVVATPIGGTVAWYAVEGGVVRPLQGALQNVSLLPRPVTSLAKNLSLENLQALQPPRPGYANASDLLPKARNPISLRPITDDVIAGGPLFPATDEIGATLFHDPRLFGGGGIQTDASIFGTPRPVTWGVPVYAKEVAVRVAPDLSPQIGIVRVPRFSSTFNGSGGTGGLGGLGSVGEGSSNPNMMASAAGGDAALGLRTVSTQPRIVPIPKFEVPVIQDLPATSTGPLKFSSPLPAPPPIPYIPYLPNADSEPLIAPAAKGASWFDLPSVAKNLVMQMPSWLAAEFMDMPAGQTQEGIIGDKPFIAPREVQVTAQPSSSTLFETFWSQNADDIQRPAWNHIKNYRSSSADLPSAATDEDIINAVMEMERIFCEHVLARLSQALGGRDPQTTRIIMYWDIDETLFSHSLHQAGVRPSINPLLTFLRDTYPQIRFGIISTRPQKILETQRTEPMARFSFSEIGHLFDPALLHGRLTGYEQGLNAFASTPHDWGRMDLRLLGGFDGTASFQPDNMNFVKDLFGYYRMSAPRLMYAQLAIANNQTDIAIVVDDVPESGDLENLMFDGKKTDPHKAVPPQFVHGQEGRVFMIHTGQNGRYAETSLEIILESRK